MVLRGPVEPYLLPAGRVAEVALAEDDPVEGGGELQVDRHPALLAGDVQPSNMPMVKLFYSDDDDVDNGDDHDHNHG